MNSFENDNASGARAFINACSSSCQKFLAQIDAAKQTILSDFRQLVGAHHEMAELALLEAEALAHQTDFPLLVYPTLAREKVAAVAAWNHRQEAMMHRANLSFSA